MHSTALVFACMEYAYKMFHLYSQAQIEDVVRCLFSRIVLEQFLLVCDGILIGILVNSTIRLIGISRKIADSHFTTC